MALHSSGGSLHQAPGALGPVFVVPQTATYWVDTEVTGPGSVQLINATTQAVISAGSGSITLTGGTAVQFKCTGITAATRGASGRIIANNGPGTER